MEMDLTVFLCLVISTLGGCASIGGCLAVAKHRPVKEGILLGLLLGPIGVAIEFRYPYLSRPPIDEKAWHSFRSMMVFQESGRETRRRRPN